MHCSQQLKVKAERSKLYSYQELFLSCSDHCPYFVIAGNIDHDLFEISEEIAPERIYPRYLL
jgi:hypothetical protein